MGLPNEVNSALIGAAAAGGYEIDQSLRFEANSATEMQKNFSVESSRNTGTTSVWIKRGRLDVVDYCIWSSREMAGYWEEFTIYSDGSIYALCRYNNATRWYMRSNALLRDPSAWYHLVYVRDTSNATQADRIRLYVNGVRVDSWAEQTEPATQGLAGFLAGNFEHKLGKRAGYDDETYDGYMAEFHFLDGTARNADSFGEFDDNGVWRPIEYTGGGYGTNGLYLKFDPAATNGIGEDYSGNGHTMPDNQFTPSGPGTDVFSDTPTNNYATLNPLAGSPALSNGNLDWSIEAKSAFSTIGVTSGKYYAELTMGANSAWVALSINPNSRLSISGSETVFAVVNDSTTRYAVNSTKSADTGATFTTNDVIGIALDAGAKTCDIYKNNTKILTFDTFTINGPYFIGIDRSGAVSGTHIMNFGQRAFAYTPPTGFKALNTANLPAPDIKDGSQYFNTVLWTGDGTANRAFTNVLDFQPNFSWVKSRSNAENHVLQDSVRGLTGTNGLQLNSNTTFSEGTNGNGDVGAYTSSGFTLSDGTSGSYPRAGVNQNNYTYAGWFWKAGTASGSSNTDGSITSTVSANPTAGFSIVSYTGNGQNSQTVGHGLGVAPRMCIGKSRSSNSWFIRHESLGSNLNLNFNTSGTVTPGGGGLIGDLTSSTTISLPGGSNAGSGNMNASGTNYIMYCFAEVEGYSKFGRYSSNNSTNGPFVYTGFSSALIMVKSLDGHGGWMMYDATRMTFNPGGDASTAYPLSADRSLAESSFWNAYQFDILSNAFKLRSSQGDVNYSGDYIFAAFAEHPTGGSGVSPANAR